MLCTFTTTKQLADRHAVTMSATAVPGAASAMAAATVRSCSTNLAKRTCTSMALMSRRKENKEFFKPKEDQSFSSSLAKRACSNLAFVPKHKETQERDIELLQEFLNPAKKLLVLTGAGADFISSLIHIFLLIWCAQGYQLRVESQTTARRVLDCMQPAARDPSSTKLSWRAIKPGRATGQGGGILR